MYGNDKGILSLLEQFTNNNKGAVSNKEMGYFMDKDSGTNIDPLKMPTRNAGAMSDTEFNAYGEAVAPLNVKDLQKKFAKILGAISQQEQAQVINAFSRTDDDGKINLMQMIVANPDIATGYGIQDEVPVNNLGF
tara:strand:+ start:151 stop:555 length:405 start_codon:yes stop_codon:yes gene_type:complete